MCGIVGLVLTRSVGQPLDYEKMFKTMLILDQLRGENSTGVILVGESKPEGNPDAVVLKRATNAMDFLQLSSVQSQIKNLKSFQYIVGHNRFATRGQVTNNNAHPFQCGNISLVHNGTISTWGKFHTEASNFSVDSHGLTYLIAKHGLDEVLPEVRGAYALVWYDKSNGTLNLLRNDERPLYMCETNFGYAFASEDWMIGAGADYSGLLINTEPKQIPIGVVQTISPRFVKGANKDILEFDLTGRDVNSFFPKSYTTGGASHRREDNWENYRNWSGHHKRNNNTNVAYLPAPNKAGINKGDLVSLRFLDFELNRASGSEYGSIIAEIVNDKNGKEITTPVGCSVFSMPKEFYDFVKEAEATEPYLVTGRVISTFDRTPHSCITKWSSHSKMDYVSIEGIKACGTVDHNGKEMLITIKPKEYKYSPNGGQKDLIDIDFVEIQKQEAKQEADDAVGSLIELEPNIENTSIDMKYSAQMGEGSGHWVGDFRSWERITKDGCAMCTCNLHPNIIDGNNVVQTKGNTIMDNQFNAWCETCWIDCTSEEGVTVNDLFNGSVH